MRTILLAGMNFPIEMSFNFHYQVDTKRSIHNNIDCLQSISVTERKITRVVFQLRKWTILLLDYN
jgi:hypothetical protein